MLQIKVNRDSSLGYLWLKLAGTKNGETEILSNVLRVF